jgi:hypothetical protein
LLIHPPPASPYQEAMPHLLQACNEDVEHEPSLPQAVYGANHVYNGSLYRVVTRMITDGWMDGQSDGRTMAVGSSVTWTNCSVRYEVTWGKTLASALTGSVHIMMPRDYIRVPQTFHSHFLHRLGLEKLRCVWCTSWSGLR